MNVLSMSTFIENMSLYIKKIQNGAIFVYPTDSIYGIGWIVTANSIRIIDQIKSRPAGKHYSIIAPSFGWIEANFDVWSDFKSKREKLSKEYGTLTLLLPLKDTDELIWVRIIDHEMQHVVAQLGEPIISTSVNISWSPSITSLAGINKEQEKLIDFAIDVGELNGKGSTIINWVTGEKIR